MLADFVHPLLGMPHSGTRLPVWLQPDPRGAAPAAGGSARDATGVQSAPAMTGVRVCAHEGPRQQVGWHEAGLALYVLHLAGSAEEAVASSRTA